MLLLQGDNKGYNLTFILFTPNRKPWIHVCRTCKYVINSIYSSRSIYSRQNYRIDPNGAILFFKTKATTNLLK